MRYNNDPFGVSEYDFIGSAYVVIADDKPPSVVSRTPLQCLMVGFVISWDGECGWE